MTASGSFASDYLHLGAERCAFLWLLCLPLALGTAPSSGSLGLNSLCLGCPAASFRAFSAWLRLPWFAPSRLEASAIQSAAEVLKRLQLLKGVVATSTFFGIATPLAGLASLN